MNDTRSTVLVTGATGIVGPDLVAHLLGRHRVRLLIRPGSVVPFAQSETVELIRGDITNPATVRDAVTGVDAVCHLAALLHRTSIAAEMAAQYRAVNVEATHTLLERSREAGVRRVVMASTIAVYGDTKGQHASEDAPLRGRTVYARTKIDAERAVLDSTRNDGQPLGCVLRLAAVYGPRLKGNYATLLRALSRRRFVPIGRGENWRSLVFTTDVARAFSAALWHDRAAGAAFNVSARPERMSSILDAMCRALGRRTPRWFIPLPVARAAAAAVDVAGRVTHLSSLDARGAVEKYVEDAYVTTDRFQDQCGFQTTVPLDEGWRITVEALRRRGELP
jgi:nucleoside-diphosphate-sugar epimerase